MRKTARVHSKTFNSLDELNLWLEDNSVKIITLTYDSHGGGSTPVYSKYIIYYHVNDPTCMQS